MRININFFLIFIPLILISCVEQMNIKENSTELPVSCLIKPDPGPCRSAQTRFYYNYHDNRCKPFTYGGCKGQVPFQTLSECQSFCGANK